MKNIKNDDNNFDYSPQHINREIKSLRNWDWTNTPNAKKERDISVGNYVELDNIMGFISRIEDDYIFIEDSLQQGKLVKIQMKDFLKHFKNNDKKPVIVSDLSMTGPINYSVSNTIKNNDFIFKNNEKILKSKEEKIPDNITKISNIKLFSELYTFEEEENNDNIENNYNLNLKNELYDCLVNLKEDISDCDQNLNLTNDIDYIINLMKKI